MQDPTILSLEYRKYLLVLFPFQDIPKVCLLLLGSVFHRHQRNMSKWKIHFKFELYGDYQRVAFCIEHKVGCDYPV